MKLVPRSHLRSLARPRSAKNLLSPQMKALASTASRTSMWMALLLRHVNTRPQRLAFGAPPLVLQVCTGQGPNTSQPTLVKGGQTSVLSCGRSAMRCFNGGPLSFLKGNASSHDLRYSVVTSNKPKSCLLNGSSSNLSPLVVHLDVVMFHYKLQHMVILW